MRQPDEVLLFISSFLLEKSPLAEARKPVRQ